MATSLSYAGNSLQTANIVTQSIEHFSLPAKTAQMYPLAHANGSQIPFVSYPNKVIHVTGFILDTSIAALDTRIDTFKSYQNLVSQNLDIDYNSTTRRYVATVNSLSIDRPNGLNWATFDIEFYCTNPFGKDTSTTTCATGVGVTASPGTYAHTFLGTAPWQQPVITITFTALTGGTAKTVSVGNLNTGQQVNITRTWVATDVLVIDATTKTVTVNGVAVAYTGAIPEFAPGAQTITYSDNLTTRTYTISGVYNAMWL